MNKLRIMIADDHALIREGLKRLVDAQQDMEVVAEASDGAMACAEAAAAHPDLILMDVSMPRMGGSEAARRIRADHPEIKVLGLTVHEDPSYLRELLEAGAVGYVLKRAAPGELVAAIHAVARGDQYIDPQIASVAIHSMMQPGRTAGGAANGLSGRELEVMRLLAQGYSNKEIAAQLELSVKTVETYKARSMEKLGLRSRVDLVRLATERGWLR